MGGTLQIIDLIGFAADSVISDQDMRKKYTISIILVTCYYLFFVTFIFSQRFPTDRKTNIQSNNYTS